MLQKLSMLIIPRKQEPVVINIFGAFFLLQRESIFCACLFHWILAFSMLAKEMNTNWNYFCHFDFPVLRKVC